MSTNKNRASLAETLFVDPCTGKPLGYEAWAQEWNLYDRLHVDQGTLVQHQHKKKDLLQAVIPNKKEPHPIEMDDLIRLHFIAITRRVTTIMEFGVGNSSIIFADAMQRNKEKHASFVATHLRRANPFEVHSLDSSKKWLAACKKRMPRDLAQTITFHYSPVIMTTFNDRICTMYKRLPNICPDLIYIDGPDLNHTKGAIRGISTRAIDRVPMAADVLFLEPFLLPGTLIIVDGRTANARFLLNNLQREWDYWHFEQEDIHAFELVEKPLGRLNAQHIRFMRNEDEECE